MSTFIVGEPYLLALERVAAAARAYFEAEGFSVDYQHWPPLVELRDSLAALDRDFGARGGGGE